MQSANDIRKEFLDYFRRHDHEVVDSSPLVPRNDPTLMFTNAGMVQFKNVFTGAEKRGYSRAVTAQKCVRAGGRLNMVYQRHGAPIAQHRVEKGLHRPPNGPDLRQSLRPFLDEDVYDVRHWVMKSVSARLKSA